MTTRLPLSLRILECLKHRAQPANAYTLAKLLGEAPMSVAHALVPLEAEERVHSAHAQGSANDLARDFRFVRDYPVAWLHETADRTPFVFEGRWWFIGWEGFYTPQVEGPFTSAEAADEGWHAFWAAPESRDAAQAINTTGPTGSDASSNAAGVVPPIEFERKFLLKADALPDLFARAERSEELWQGYFMEDEERCVRIRRIPVTSPEGEPLGTRSVMTLKARTAEVGKLAEIEFDVPSEAAAALPALCKSSVHKRRSVVTMGEFTWEIDEFLDHNAGLVLAEVELSDDAQSARLSAALPAFVEREVTGEPQYFNTWLSRHCIFG